MSVPVLTMSITLDHATLARAKELMLRPYETSGHFDVDLDGRVERTIEKPGVQTLSLQAADYEINYHTHPPLYDQIFPDHPSVTDYKFCAFVLGYTREVQAHMVFTPKYIYVISPRPELFAKTDTLDGYDRVAQQAEEEYLRVRTRYPNRDSVIFEREWMQAGARLGLDVRRFGDEGDPYTGTVTVPLTPVEPTLLAKAVPWVAAAAVVGVVGLVAWRHTRGGAGAAAVTG